MSGDAPVTRPDLDALIAAAHRDIDDVNRCLTMGIMPSAYRLHRRLREVTAALAAERARADQAERELALSDKQHHDCIEKLHKLRAQLAEPSDQ